MQHETELVVDLSRTPLSGASRVRIERRLSEPVEWEAFCDLAARWQVEPTVFGNLRTDYAAAVPAAVLSDIIPKEKEARALAVMRTLMLVDLVRRLREAGIRTIVLKGPAVAIAAYGDYSRRTFGDVDLLLHRSDLPQARDFLLTRGLVRNFSPEMERALIADQHALEFSDARTKVELHWSLLSRHLRFDIDLDRLWADSEKVNCMGEEITVLRREHLFLYLCAHAAKHEWALFRWILDVAQLEQRMDGAEAERVMALAEGTNTRRILALALRLVRDTFGDENSPFPARALLPDRETRALVELVRSRLDPAQLERRRLLPARVERIHPYVGPLAFWIRSRERKRDQIACAARFLFVPAASEAGEGRLHGLVRPARLVGRALRRVVQPRDA